MTWLCAVSCLAVCVLLTGSASAEGLLYKLAEDGAWAAFEINGKGVEPNDSVTTVSGTVTISSVGTVDVAQQKCRWIEIATEAKRNDDMFTTVEKFLIPEKHLALGENPLEHVLKAWTRHSMEDGGAAHQIQDVQNPESRGGKYVRSDALRPFLHGPFKAPQKLDKALVECKLGKLACEGISAQEHRAGKPSCDSKYLLRLHPDAPFGVVTLEVESKFEQNGQPLATMTTKLTLSGYGKDAKSKIPEARD